MFPRPLAPSRAYFPREERSRERRGRLISEFYIQVHIRFQEEIFPFEDFATELHRVSSNLGFREIEDRYRQIVYYRALLRIRGGLEAADIRAFMRRQQEFVGGKS